METDGGGWTVLLRRQDGSVEFNRVWTEYESGFGTLTGEHWLGLSKMHRLTPDSSNILRFDLGDFEGNKSFAKYSVFEILDVYTKYAIVVGSYNGTAGDSFTRHNTMKFTTSDRDNDILNNANCGVLKKSGWWFVQCYQVHLTSPYIPGGTTTSWYGIIWYLWKGEKYSLKFAEMKVRRN